MTPGPGASLPEPETAGGEERARLEAYVRGHFAPEDEALLEIRRTMAREGLPTIQIPAVTARTIQLLLRIAGARRVLEVGTLAGYSAVWIARALPEPAPGAPPPLLSLERDPDRASLARRLLAGAGVADRVDVRVGNAREVLPHLGPDGAWDAVFLDADKEGLPDYVAAARRLLRTGGLLLVDNALWKGRVADPEARDPDTEGVRRSHDLVARDPGFDAVILPVGDGLLVAHRI